MPPLGAGKSAPLLIQQLQYYLPTSGSLTLPTPQFPATDAAAASSSASATAPVVVYRSIHELHDHAPQDKAVEVAFSAHVHRFISDVGKTSYAAAVKAPSADPAPDAASSLSATPAVDQPNSTDQPAALQPPSEPSHQPEPPAEPELPTLRLVCSICRYHFTITLDPLHHHHHASASTTASSSSPADCGTVPEKLHHFIPVSHQNLTRPFDPDLDDDDEPNASDDPTSTTAQREITEAEEFKLSCYICSTVVSVVVRRPHISRRIADTFTADSIKSRIETFDAARRAKIAPQQDQAAAADEQPPQELPPISIPTPNSAYNTFYKILGDPLTTPSGKAPHSIRIDNQTLNTKLHPEIIRRFGFIKNEESGQWQPPLVNENTQVSKQLKRLLQEARMEIAIIVRALSNDTENPYNISTDLELPALRSFLRCSSYPKYARTVAYVEPTSPVSLRFASLGATPDFSDSLLLQTFDRQNDCDPLNSAYYLECLQQLSTTRASEELQIRVVELQSLGALTRGDVRDAYRDLGIDDPEAFNDDSLILGIFKARLQDTPSTGTKLKSALQIVANHRNSELLRAYLQAESMDEAQSYKVLAVEKETDDELIISSYEVNLREVPEKRDVLNSALLVLAKKRQSPKLLTFAELNNLTGPVPDVEAAFAVLGVQSAMEDSHLLTVFDIRVSDNPDEILTMRNAMRAIMIARKSNILRTFLESGTIDLNIAPEGSETEPVGLRNIGNTCYLNSLLQFYFTIKPLRELLINNSDESNINSTAALEQDMESALARGEKRIGGRIVTEWEIRRALDFVRELGGLFESMICSSEGAVAPNQELAYLALVSSIEAWEDWQKIQQQQQQQQQQVVKADQVMTDAEEEGVVQGPATAEESVSAETEIASVQVPIKEDVKEDVVMEDKENLSPVSKTEEVVKISQLSPERQVLGVLPDGVTNSSGNSASSASSIVIEDDAVEATKETEESKDIEESKEVEESKETAEPPPLPKRTSTSTTIPPSVPPRNNSNMMFGSQQDVTECIDNVLFQIEAALKPERVDSDGEQIDMVKDLFYGKTQQTLEVRDGSSSSSVRTKEERFSHLIVDVAAGPRDIYEALDACFDVETVDLDGKPARRYVTVLELPPILQIQIQRVQYDRGLGRVFKSNAPIIFGETVYMDRYMDDAEVQKRREQMWAWKEQVAELEKKRAKMQAVLDTVNQLSGEQTLRAARSWLRRVQEATAGLEEVMEDEQRQEADLLGDEDKEESKNREEEVLLAEVVEELEAEMAEVASAGPQVDAEIEALNKKIQAQFSDLKQLGYRVHSVFIHRGQATFGHYWIYIYDYENGVFRKYNDEHVTVVSAEEVMPFAESASVGSGDYDVTAGTPYFLVFVREDMTEQLVEAVRRRIREGEKDQDLIEL